MICTELMILTHVGPFFLPVRHNTQPIGGMSACAARGAKRGYYADALIPSQNIFKMSLILSMYQGMLQKRKKAFGKKLGTYSITS